MTTMHQRESQERLRNLMLSTLQTETNAGDQQGMQQALAQRGKSQIKRTLLIDINSRSTH